MYLLLVAMLYIPIAQKGVTNIVTNVLENKLQTNIQIESINIGFLNRIVLNNVIIEDQNNQELLTAAKLSAKLEILPLFKGEVSISSIQFYGFNINLYRSENDNKTNFQFLIDAFKTDKESESDINLNINSILIRKGLLSWHNRNYETTPDIFNYNHLDLEDISATISLKEFSKDSINLKVKKISAKDKSGLTLKKLSFDFCANRGSFLIDKFRVELPKSFIELSTIKSTYNQKDKTSNNNKKKETFTLEGRIKNSALYYHDFSAFYNPLKTLNQKEPIHLETDIIGSLEELKINTFNIYTKSRSVDFDSKFVLQNINNKESLEINSYIKKLYIDKDVATAFSSLINENKTKEQLIALFPINIYGKGNYSHASSNTDLTITTEHGNITISGILNKLRHTQFSISSDSFNFQNILKKQNLLGNTIFSIKGSAEIDKDNPQINIESEIKELEIKGYKYKNISLNGKYKDKSTTAVLNIEDPNINLTSQAFYMGNNQSSSFKTDTKIGLFRPNNLLLSTKYPNISFSTDIKAEFKGKNIEDLNGEAHIYNFTMNEQNEIYNLDTISFSAYSNKQYKQYILDSEFLFAELEGKFNFEQILANGKKMIGKHIPSLIQSPLLKENLPNEATLFIEITDTKPFEKILGIPIKLDKTAYMSGYFNSEQSEMDLNLSVPHLIYDTRSFGDISIIGSNTNDSLTCKIDAKNYTNNHPIDINILLKGLNDNIQTSVAWDNNSDNKYCGNISINTSFYKIDKTIPESRIQILPTDIVINDTIWNIYESNITLNPNKININNLKLGNRDKHIIIDGKVSDQIEDSIKINLKEIDLEYVFDIINFHPVDFAGYATGNAYIANIKASPELQANLKVRSFTFNKAHLGNMNLLGGWRKEKNTIHLNAHITDYKNNSTTNVNGEVRLGAPPKGGLDLMIRTNNIDLYFLNKYTSGIFTNLNGRASGWTRVFGPFKGINLEGDMFINKANLKINATNVDYHVLNDSVILRPGKIIFKNARIYDKYGRPNLSSHYGVINGYLQHHYLSQMTYNIDVDTYNILGYDEKDFGDNVFCGTAYATGKIKVVGEPGKLNINIDATPEKNTLFMYNLSSPTALTDNQFITYKKKTNTADENSNKEDVYIKETTSDINLNFNLNLKPDATMKILMDPKTGDYISLNGYGNIRANYYNKGKFTMFGTYKVDHGIYKLSLQDVIRKDFTYNPGGTIVFGGNPIEADLNLQAVYTVPSVSLNDLSARSTFNQNNVRVNCLMNLGGKAQAPQISFDFDLPNVNEDEKQMVRALISTEEEKNMQVIYLLGIGRFYTYDYNNTEQSQSSVAMKSLLSSTISGQLNQIFSSILGNNSNWNIGTNLSTGDVGWSDMDVEGLLSGRLLNNRLLINGNFGYRDNSTTQTSNFIGDFDLQWVLTKNGNINLKAYSKTNDRYFTKSSLTTQGVGIAVKRDFNSWKDIFNLFIPKKHRQVKSSKTN